VNLMLTTGHTSNDIDGGWLFRWLIHQCPDRIACELVTAMPSIPNAAGVRRGMGAGRGWYEGGSEAVGVTQVSIRC
jgi:hypothetical protein